MLLSVTGCIFSLQWSGVVGCSLCLLHATFRPPVARAVRSAARSGSGGGGVENPELHGDGDLEGGGGGGGGAVGRGRAGPVNANIRLRTRPMGGPGGLAHPLGSDPFAPGGGARQHSHGS